MTDPLKNVLFFYGRGNARLGEEIFSDLSECAGKKIEPARINFAAFSDGEEDDNFNKWKEIKGKVIVFHQAIFEKLLINEFLQLCWAMKNRYGAKEIVAVLPFVYYRRQDHVEFMDEIPRLEWLIANLSYNGVDHLITVTPHSSEMEELCGKHGIDFHEADLSLDFAMGLRPYLSMKKRDLKIFVYAPDRGSLPRATHLAKTFGCNVIFDLKLRAANNETTSVDPTQKEIQKIKKQFSVPGISIEYASADLVKDSVVIMIEDEVSSGGTANRTACKLRDLGVKEVYFIATHAACVNVPGWQRKLFNKNPFTQVFMTDTIPRGTGDRTGGRIFDIHVSGAIAAELFKFLRELSEEE